MPTIKFEELLVDQPDFKNPGLLTANNVIPYARGYKPFPTLETFTGTIDNRARGLFGARSTTNDIKIVCGDASKLYMLDGTTWDDVSKSGGYNLPSTDNWSFTIFGNNIIAANIGDNIQKFEIGTDTLFSDLVSLKAKFVTVIGDFLVTAYNENQPQRVRWSALNDPTDFTVSQTTQSDFQDIVGDHGAIQGIVGGEYGIVFTEKATNQVLVLLYQVVLPTMVVFLITCQKMVSMLLMVTNQFRLVQTKLINFSLMIFLQQALT